MHLHTYLLPLVALATTLANATTASSTISEIVASLNRIERETIAMNKTMATWNGGLFYGVPLFVQSFRLIGQIRDGTKAASAVVSDETLNLTAEENMELIEGCRRLARNLGETIDTTIDARSKFERLDMVLNAVVGAMISSLHKTTSEYAAAMQALVPEDRATILNHAETIIGEVDGHFMRGKDAYL